MRLRNKIPLVGTLFCIFLVFTCKSKVNSDKSGNTTEELLPWIHNDYSEALKQSHAKGLPILIDFWAAWCHTCLSMKHTVLEDESLQELSNRYIWLAIDTENPANKEAMDVYTITVWPTFLVIDENERIAARQLGSTSVDVFKSFLERGLNDIRNVDATSELSQADSEAALGNHHEASIHYQKAVEALPDNSVQKPERILAWMESLHRLERYDECSRVGTKHLDTVSKTKNATLADFAYFLTDCQKRSAATDPAQTRVRLTSLLENLLKNRSAQLSVDDRSEALRLIRTFYEKGGASKSAQKAAERQALLLDKAVASSQTYLEEMTYSYHRMDVYAYLGKAKELIPWFKKLSDKLPNEYDPPYRLASLYNQLEQFENALKYADLAEKRSQGPRMARILTFKGKIYSTMQQINQAVAAQHQAIKILEKQPQTPRTVKTLKTYRSELLRYQSQQN